MRNKPRIYRREGGVWCVQLPVFGFRTTSDEIEHESWKDAVDSMKRRAEHFASSVDTEIRAYRIAAHVARADDVIRPCYYRSQSEDGRK